MYENQKILLTGASGFLGKAIRKELVTRNLNVIGLNRTKVNEIDIQADLSNIPKLNNFDVVIHCAGKAHSIPKTPKETEDFFRINFQGTKNLLSALVEKPKTFIFISSVSVYGKEIGELITEEFELKGETPYALSKIKAEKEIIEWCKINQVNYLILRLPLIVGKNPPGNLSAIANAINKKFYIKIKGNNARKSAVLAADVGAFIAENLFSETNGQFNLTDGVHPKFNQIESALEKSVNSKILFELPLSLIAFLSKIGSYLSFFPLNANKLKKITGSLTFSDEKAKRELGWKSNSVLKFIEMNDILSKS